MIVRSLRSLVTVVVALKLAKKLAVRVPEELPERSTEKFSERSPEKYTEEASAKSTESHTDPSPTTIPGYDFNDYSKSSFTSASQSAPACPTDTECLTDTGCPTDIECLTSSVSQPGSAIAAPKVLDQDIAPAQPNPVQDKLDSQDFKTAKVAKPEPLLQSKLSHQSDFGNLAQNQFISSELLNPAQTKSDLNQSELNSLGLIKNRLNKNIFAINFIYNPTPSYLFSPNQPIPDLNLCNQNLAAAHNSNLVEFQPALSFAMPDNTVDCFENRLEGHHTITPNFRLNRKSGTFRGSTNKLNSKLNINKSTTWKTITFSSSLQLSPILEILLSHIPAFWQAELRLGLQEALVNAVKHGNQLDPHKQIKISFSLNQNCYWWIIEDQGIDCSCSEAISEYLTQIPTLEQDESECGRGIYILRQIFNRVHWDQQKHHLYLFKQINQFDLPCIV